MNGLPDEWFITINTTGTTPLAAPSGDDGGDSDVPSDYELQELSTADEVEDAIEYLEDEGYYYQDVIITDVSDDGSGEFVVQFDYNNGYDTQSITTSPFSDTSDSYDDIFDIALDKLGIEDLESEVENVANRFKNGELFKYEAVSSLEKLGAKCLFSDDNTIKYVFNGTTHSYTIQNNDEPLLTRGAGGSNVELTNEEKALSVFLETYADGGDFNTLKTLLGGAGVTYDQDDDTIRFNFQGCDYEFSSKTENPQNEEPVDMSPNAQIDRMIQDFISGKISTYDAKDLIEGLGGTVHSYSLGSGQDKYSIEFTFNGKRQKITYDSSIEDKEGTKIIKEEDLSEFLDSCSMLPSTKAQIFNGWFKKVTDGYYILDEQVNDRDGTYDIHLANLRETVASEIITIDDVKKYLTNYVNNTKAQTIVDVHEFIRDYGRYQHITVQDAYGPYKFVINEDEYFELKDKLFATGVKYSETVKKDGKKYLNFEFEGREYEFHISKYMSVLPCYDEDVKELMYRSQGYGQDVMSQTKINEILKNVCAGDRPKRENFRVEDLQEIIDNLNYSGFRLRSTRIGGGTGSYMQTFESSDPYTHKLGYSHIYYLEWVNPETHETRYIMFTPEDYESKYIGGTKETHEACKNLLLQQLGFENQEDVDNCAAKIIDAWKNGIISTYIAQELVEQMGANIDSVVAIRKAQGKSTSTYEADGTSEKQTTIQFDNQHAWIDCPGDAELMEAFKGHYLSGEIDYICSKYKTSLTASSSAVENNADNGGNSSRRSSYESSNESNDSNEVPTTSSNPFVDYNNGRYDSNSKVFSLAQCVSLAGMIGYWQQFFIEVNGGYVLDKTALKSYFGDGIASGITDIDSLAKAYQNKNAKTSDTPAPKAVDVKTETDKNGNTVKTYKDESGNVNKIEYSDSNGTPTKVEYYEDKKLVTDETIYNEIKNDLEKVLNNSNYSASVKAQLRKTYSSLLLSGKTPDEIRAYMKQAIQNAEKITKQELRLYYIVAMMKRFAGIEEDKLNDKEKEALSTYKGLFT